MLPALALLNSSLRFKQCHPENLPLRSLRLLLFNFRNSQKATKETKEKRADCPMMAEIEALGIANLSAIRKDPSKKPPLRSLR
jgi:hypothetical protein